MDSIRGFDVYLHTLRLPAPCVVLVPGNRVFWIEVFNGTGVDISHAPGVQWGPVFTPLAFVAKITDVGATQNLRLSKLPDDELGLQWDGDCGGGGDFSVYRGSLETGYSSLAPEPGLCEVCGRSVTIPAGDGAADFFLVVPWVASCAGCDCDPADDNCRSEGSYGADSGGTARPQPSTYCYWQTSNDMHDCAP